MKLLVPVDGSGCSLRALDAAVGFAADLRADVVICTVVNLAEAAILSGGESQLVPGCLETLQTNAETIAAEALARVGGRVDAKSRVVEGNPVEEIERVADEIRAAFIVMGSHGHTGLKRAFVGSVAEGVLRRAPVPVMVVRSRSS